MVPSANGFISLQMFVATLEADGLLCHFRRHCQIRILRDRSNAKRLQTSWLSAAVSCARLYQCSSRASELPHCRCHRPAVHALNRPEQSTNLPQSQHTTVVSTPLSLVCHNDNNTPPGRILVNSSTRNEHATSKCVHLSHGTWVPSNRLTLNMFL